MPRGGGHSLLRTPFARGERLRNSSKWARLLITPMRRRGGREGASSQGVLPRSAKVDHGETRLGGLKKRGRTRCCSGAASETSWRRAHHGAASSIPRKEVGGWWREVLHAKFVYEVNTRAPEKPRLEASAGGVEGASASPKDLTDMKSLATDGNTQIEKKKKANRPAKILATGGWG